MRFAQMFQKKEMPSLSFEFFRPKTAKAEENLDKTIDILSKHNPDYMTVTFGAGGSSREGSFELIDKLRNKRGFDVVAYIAGIGLGPNDIESILKRFNDLGVENVFAIRGDEPKGDAAFTPHPEALPHASDLISFIKERYDFCVGAAGYPEGHIEASSKEEDIGYLKLKQDCGAEYILSQFCYDNNDFYDFVNRCRDKGITIPILPGIMPIYSHSMLNTVAEVCGARIPQEVREGLDKISSEDKEEVLQFGVDYATRQCEDLLKNGVQGLHFYTMNRASSADAVLKRLREKGLF